MDECDPKKVVDCVTADPALGLALYGSWFGCLVLVFLVVITWAALKQLTGARNVLNVFTFFFRGLFAFFFKFAAIVSNLADRSRNKGALLADLALYVVGLVGVGLLVGLTTTSYVMNILTALVGVVIFLALYISITSSDVKAQAIKAYQAKRDLFERNSYYYGADARELAAVDLAKEEIAESDIGFINSFQSVLGGASLGLIIAFIYSGSRFLTVRGPNSFGDILYITAGVGIFAFMITIYGYTLPMTRSGKRKATMVYDPETQVASYLAA
jgi:type IV secretory pathway VirB3-like protein